MSAEASLRGGTSILTVGFGTSITMWLIGYVCHIPPVIVPAPVVAVLMLACLIAGGVVAGRHMRGGWRTGSLAGVVASIVNMLILGSLLIDPESNRFVPSALLWLPGALLGGALLGAIGGTIGATMRGRILEPDQWRSGFAAMTAIATLLVVIAGGLVTSWEEGLAVPDWPNTFGTNMFIYPLSRMTGGIYYEHAHRLYGALVGLTTIVLAILLWFARDERRWLRRLGVAAVAMVVVQGVMGGLRVDSSLSGSTDFDATAPNLTLAIVHGVFGQCFFVLVTLIWAFTTRTWRRMGEARPEPSASTDYALTATLVGTLLVQLALGAMYRHTYSVSEPMPAAGVVHLTLAAIVAALAFLAGLRSLAVHGEHTVLRRLGMALLALLAVQFLLGIAALVAVFVRREGPYPIEVVLTTAHQANGALLFAIAVQLAVWMRRSVVPQPQAVLA
jgi:cytochrome c oxidase assembly protein subunit 15